MKENFKITVYKKVKRKKLFMRFNSYSNLLRWWNKYGHELGNPDNYYIVSRDRK